MYYEKKIGDVKRKKVIIRYVLMLLVFIHSQFSGKLIFVEKIALKIGKNELALLLIITNGNEKFINETCSTCFWCLYTKIHVIDMKLLKGDEIEASQFGYSTLNAKPPSE